MAEVLEHLPVRPQVALIDAMPVQVKDMETVPIVHGDALSVSIAAASIIAKVTRDRIMERLDEKFPAYGFANNKPVSRPSAGSCSVSRVLTPSVL